MPARLALAAVLGCLLVVAFVYWPGLAGPFLFDDIGAIADLGRYGGIDDWHSFRQFVFGGTTGPTGRPLSMLSFLIDGTNWPTDPWPFKRTNLVIHLANGLLIATFCKQALGIVGITGRRAVAIATVSALCWALHPFFVSTVLYPVQRMAQLAALFSLAGMNLYAWGRTRVASRGIAAYVAMTAATGVCSVLAVTSKENGALLPVLIGVFELTVVAAAGVRVPALNRAWAALFLWLPALVVIGYLVTMAFVWNLFAQLEHRGFSLYERLLTEGRIVARYLRHLLLPSLFTSGIFHDDIEKSTSLIRPATTLVAAVFHLAVIAIAWMIRKRFPLFAFAILFYYAGHLVESTIVGLELYFEHRNYLPAAFLFLPVAALVAQKFPTRAAVAVCVVALAVLAGFTRYSAGIWSSYDTIIEASAAVSPDSARAQQQYSMLLFNDGRIDAALEVSARGLERSPDNQSLGLWHLVALCRSGRLDPVDLQEQADAVADQLFDLRALAFYESLVESISGGSCPGVTVNDVAAYLDRLLDQPMNGNPASAQYAQLHYLKGLAFVLGGEPAMAQAQFESSLDARWGVGRVMQMAALFAASGHYEEALHFSDIALGYISEDGAMSGQATGVTRADIDDFRRQVLAEMSEQAGPGPVDDPLPP